MDDLKRMLIQVQEARKAGADALEMSAALEAVADYFGLTDDERLEHV